MRALMVNPEYAPAIEALEQLTKPGRAVPADAPAAQILRDLQFGTVKWFNAQKGFGFVSPAGGGADIFVHVSSVEGSQQKLELMTEGTRVAYIARHVRGKFAVSDIRVVPR